MWLRLHRNKSDNSGLYVLRHPHLNKNTVGANTLAWKLDKLKQKGKGNGNIMPNKWHVLRAKFMRCTYVAAPLQVPSSSYDMPLATTTSVLTLDDPNMFATKTTKRGPPIRRSAGYLYKAYDNECGAQLRQ